MAETILVTGATGTVGSEVVKQLLSAKGQREEDIIVKAAVRSAKDNTFRNLGVQVVQLDYNKPDSLSAALRGVDKLFLLTPFQSNMVDLTSNLLNEAKQAGVKYIVKQSVLGADAEPGITSSRLHRQAEKIIEESGIPFTFLRPNFFMQNFVTFYSHFIKTQGAFYMPAGDAKASFVDVRDIAAVAVQALSGSSKNGESKHIRKAYDITGREALSYGQAAETLSREIGKQVNYVNISDEDASKGMKDMGIDDWMDASHHLTLAVYRLYLIHFVSMYLARQPNHDYWAANLSKSCEYTSLHGCRSPVFHCITVDLVMLLH